MRRLVTCHHLASIGEDGGGEQAESIDTWVGDEYEGVLGGVVGIRRKGERKVEEKHIRFLTESDIKTCNSTI